MRLRKRVADQHFVVRERRRHASGAQIQAVERRRARIRQGDHSSLNRFVEAGHLQLGGGQYTRLHFGNAGRFGNPRSHGFGRTLESGPQIGKAVVLVQPRARVAQRIERGLRHHQHGNARSNDQRNGQRLPAHQPQVTQRLEVNGLHVSACLAARCR